MRLLRWLVPWFGEWLFARLVGMLAQICWIASVWVCRMVPDRVYWMAAG